MDAIAATKYLSKKVDLIYFDSPYCGSHADYQSFYHLLETYAEYWKDKEFKNSTKRYFPKKYSGFDTKKEIISSSEKLFKSAAPISNWIISYNDRSFPDTTQMVSMIKKYKNVEIDTREYKNDVGGKGSVKGSREILFICTEK